MGGILSIFYTFILRSNRMKISLQKKLNKDKTKAYLILCKYKGNKIVNGKTKAVRVRESLGLFLWVNPKGIKQTIEIKDIT